MSDNAKLETVRKRGGVAIAIDRDKNSQSALKWAAENLLKKTRYCVLLHVRCQSMHPDDSDFVPRGGRPPTEAELRQFFLPFRGFCARKGISAKEVVLHDIDVPSAVVEYIVANSIVNVVVGASSRNMLMRKIKPPDVATALMRLAPQFCSVYAIVKDRVHTVRHAKHSMTDSGRDTPADTKDSPLRWTPQTKIQNTAHDTYDVTRSSSSLSSESIFSLKSSDLANTDNDHRNWRPTASPAMTLQSFFSQNSSSTTSTSDFSRPLSFQSTDNSEPGSYSYISENSAASLSGIASTPRMDEEMARLQLEFQQSLSVYNMACQDLAKAEKMNEIRQKHSAEIRELEDEDAPIEMWSSPRPEKLMAKLPLKRLPIEQHPAQLNSENKERQKLAMSRLGEQECQELGASLMKYSINDIESATGDFSDSRKIGEGGYGPVYVGVLDETPVAIKVLRPDVSQGLRQFQQEVEVLGGMKHPNMVHLVGACPEYGCLVYEYMDYGSLEDRLFCKDDTPPIPWRTRFKIAAEIAMGLLFLHQTKPEPLVHRDIKPSNILLDKNYRCKIGDVGLARLVPASVADKVTQYHLTAAAGTFCYIDPEYQQTGMLGCKSDVYSFGVVLLQILTSKAPMGLALRVEDSIEEGSFGDILDPAITDWPVEEAESLAKLALKCCELRRRDRPDLASVVLPALNRIKNLGLDRNSDETQGQDLDTHL